jgi:hypothetical protein
LEPSPQPSPAQARPGEQYKNSKIWTTPYTVPTISQAYFALQKTLRIVKNFKEKIFLVLRLSFGTFLSSSQTLKSHVFREAHKRNFELANKTLNFQAHLNVLWGIFMGLLCFRRWSDHFFCRTECVALWTNSEVGCRRKPRHNFIVPPETHDKVIARLFHCKIIC